MASVCKSLALLQGFTAVVLGFRVQSSHEMLAEFTAEVRKWTFEGNPHTICGGSTIWSLITGPSADAQNIQWNLVESYQKTFVEEQSRQKANIEAKLSALQKQLEEALQKESLPDTGTEQHKALIGAGVQVFGGTDAAHMFGCGNPTARGPNGERLKVRRAFKQAEEAFATASSEFFGKQEFRLGDKFLSDCEAMLVKGVTDAKSRCPRLCQRFKNMAHKDSYEAVGAVAKTSDEIKDKMEALRRQLTQTIGDMEQCGSDWSSLSTFKDQLAGLKGTYEECSDAFAAAEQGLDDALWAMEGLEEEMGMVEAAADLSEKLLEENQALTADAKTALENSIAKEKDLMGKVTTLESDLAETSADVKAALTATSLIERLKELVVATMMRMEIFFDAGVREPIQNIGFTEDPSDVGFPDVMALESAAVMKKALTNMHDYCEESAKPAFAETLELMPGIDLSPLCAFDNVDEMFNDLAAQVEKRKAHIKKDILAVVSWLNPWKEFKNVPMEVGQQKEMELVEGGQLMYLEQVKAIYAAPSNEFFPYLIGWRKDGPHHQLTLHLSETLAALKAKEKALKKSLQEMDDAHSASAEATEEAKKALASALEKEEVSKTEVESLQAAMEALQEYQGKLEDDIAAWREKVAKALKAMEEAQATLNKAYADGIAVE